MRIPGLFPRSGRVAGWLFGGDDSGGRRAHRTLRRQVILISFLSVIAGLAVHFVLGSSGAPLDRARRLVLAGETAEAEELYWEILRSGAPDLPLFVEFLDNHRTLSLGAPGSFESGPQGGRSAPEPQKRVISEVEIDTYLDRAAMSDETAILMIYWREVQSDTDVEIERGPVEKLAMAKPPVRYANHLRAREAEMDGKFEEAADGYEREGLAFPQMSRDLETSLRLRADQNDWEEIGKRLADPRFRDAARAGIRFHHAVATRNWAGAARWFFGSLYDRVSTGPLLLAILAAALWFLFCLRLGRVEDRIRFRAPLYFAAFFLGILSVYPTVVAIIVEEDLFGFIQKGNWIAELIYFVFGVGLREELMKLLLFAPLLLFFRRQKNRLETLSLGALVGLGFAAEENLAYFHEGDLSTALGRFLTANFLHISLTALLASSFADFVDDPGGKSDELMKTFLLVVGLHGAYDFFLESRDFAEVSFLAMTIFVILARRFLREVNAVRPAGGPGIPLFSLFVYSVTILSGASYVYATTKVGPFRALIVLGPGLLGSIIQIVMFVRELDGV